MIYYLCVFSLVFKENLLVLSGKKVAQILYFILELQSWGWEFSKFKIFIAKF